MTILTIGQGGEVRLPDDVCERYGLTAQSPLQLVETPGGIFLIPQGGGSVSEQFIHELEEWQMLGAEAWGQFPFEEGKP